MKEGAIYTFCMITTGIIIARTIDEKAWVLVAIVGVLVPALYWLESVKGDRK